jgi:probable addiction module antidote protein
MAEKILAFDAAEFLETEDDIALFLSEALATGDVKHIAHCLGIAARAKGMTSVARETGLAREQLYRSFSEEGNPSLKSTLAVMKALGISLTATPAKHISASV